MIRHRQDDSHLILEIPDAIFVREFLVLGAAFGQNATLEAAHVEQQVGIVLTIHANKTALPLYGGHRAWQTVLDVPKYGAAAAKSQQIFRYSRRIFRLSQRTNFHDKRLDIRNEFPHFEFSDFQIFNTNIHSILFSKWFFSFLKFTINLHHLRFSQIILAMFRLFTTDFHIYAPNQSTNIDGNGNHEHCGKKFTEFDVGFK